MPKSYGRNLKNLQIFFFIPHTAFISLANCFRFFVGQRFISDQLACAITIAINIRFNSTVFKVASGISKLYKV